MLKICTEHRVGSGGRRGKRHDEKKKDEAGSIRSDTVTPPVIVQGLPPRNLYWEIAGREDKGCESGIGEVALVGPEPGGCILLGSSS
jgi:hypothetical protein